MSTSAVRRRLPADRTAVVAIGDLLVVGGLLVVGVVSHGGDPIAADTVETILPFAAGWIAVAVAAGAYDRRAVSSPGRSVRVAGIAWIAAANVGFIARSSPAFDGGASWPFNLIITGLGLVALGLWRAAYAVAVDDRR